MNCLGVIPGTFTVCGEGKQYCSELCWATAVVRKVEFVTCMSDLGEQGFCEHCDCERAWHHRGECQVAAFLKHRGIDVCYE